MEMKKAGQVMQILYADVLFLINFYMDFFALYLSGKILHTEVKRTGLLLASGIGALYSLLTVMYSGNSVVSIIIDIFASVIITVIAFFPVRNKKMLAKTVVMFYVISLLLGGIITFLYGFLNKIVEKADISEAKGLVRVAVFLILGAISALCISISNGILKSTVKSKSVFVKLKLDNKTVTFDALVDSGNLLSDPISGKQVIVASMSAVETVLPFDIRRIVRSNCCDISDISPRSAKRIRLIPARGIGGSKTFIGIIPDRIEIKETGKNPYRISAIIAIDEGQRYRFGGYGAVMPSALIC